MLPLGLSHELVPGFRWSSEHILHSLVLLSGRGVSVQLTGFGLWAAQTLITEALQSWADNQGQYHLGLAANSR